MAEIENRGATAAPKDLRISRADDGRWLSVGMVVFQAEEASGAPVLVELPIPDWDRIVDEGGGDPLARVEQLASEGEWHPYGDGTDRIWRTHLR